MDLFKQLKAYSESYELALKVYEKTKEMPREERYGLTDQMRRASMSIPATIAEGYAKKEQSREYKRYLLMALGSRNEMKVWLDMSRDLKLLDNRWCDAMYGEYDKAAGLIAGIVKKIDTGA